MATANEVESDQRLEARVKGFIRELGATFWLQVALLVTAARSVESAGWVETPPLVLIAFVAALTAALVVRLGGRGKKVHLWAVLSGGFVAYGGGLHLTDAAQWYMRFDALNGRVARWWSAVVGNDATTDTLPLSVTVIAITWFVAYLTSWGLFRYRNIWTTLLPIGVGVVLNLTYLPDRFFIYLFVFLFIGLLMLLQVATFKRRLQLESDGIPHPPSFYRASLVHGFWLTVVVLCLVAVFPIKDPPTPLNVVFRPADRLVDRLQDEVYRVFAVVPSYDPSSIRFFRSVLPLVRHVPMGEDPILFSSSLRSLYWPAVAYDQYTSKAWRFDDTELIQVPSYISAIGDAEELSAFGEGSVEYSVHLFVDSPYLLLAGSPYEVGIRAKKAVPASKRFSIDMSAPEQNIGLTDAQKKLAVALVASATRDGNPDLEYIPFEFRVSRVIKEVSPSNRQTTTIIDVDSSLYYIDLYQAIDAPGKTVELEMVQLPMISSTVFYQSQERLRRGSEYSVVAGLDTASEEALRNASGEYPSGILDRYLQVPDTLPSRVSALASDIVGDASNPYDKAVAIEAYLRDLKYAVAPQPIPFDADTVDYFLFESREGYCDYFASAMALMLRTQGIPTRLVLGFGPGEGDPELRGFWVRDIDSHSWPEVYFPNSGWVPFEPTPIYDVRPRGLPANPLGLDELFGGQYGEGETEGTGGSPELEGETRERNDVGGPLPGGQGLRPLPARHFGTPLGLGGALFAIFLVTGALLMRVFWVWQYGGLPSPRAVYERMRRLVLFLGFPASDAQTAYEFSKDLSRLVPEVGTEVGFVSETFVRHRYGGIAPSTTEEARLVEAWHRIKGALVAPPIEDER